MKSLCVMLVMAAGAAVNLLPDDNTKLAEVSVEQALTKVRVESQPELPNTVEQSPSTSTGQDRVAKSVSDELLKDVIYELKAVTEELRANNRLTNSAIDKLNAKLFASVKSEAKSEEPQALAAVGPAVPQNCRNGECDTQRLNYSAPVTNTVYEGQVYEAGPVRAVLGRVAGGIRRVAYRVTHPFGGRFRCR